MKPKTETTKEPAMPANVNSIQAPAPAFGIEIDNSTSIGAIDMKKVRGSLNELRALCRRKIDAAEAFADACKSVAEKAGLKPPVLTAYVNALVRDKMEEHEEKARQLSLLFEEI
jgi:hypothetical protein